MANMEKAADRRVSNMPEEVELPRDNGELVFDAPWESRAFGMAVVLNESGKYEWPEFVNNLADEIKLDLAEEHTYYEKWLHTLADLVAERGLFSETELDQRTHEYATGARNDDDH